MTDLPFGRGGSPLQNLIVRGITNTKISVIKVNTGIDTGDIYCKRDLSLIGTAREIFERSYPIIGKMIKEIIDYEIKPKPQIGEVVVFSRRKPEESDISNLDDLVKMYNYIRMLDCEGYPKAFIETKYFKFEFSDATYNFSNELINANVRITKK